MGCHERPQNGDGMSKLHPSTMDIVTWSLWWWMVPRMCKIYALWSVFCFTIIWLYSHVGWLSIGSGRGCGRVGQGASVWSFFFFFFCRSRCFGSLVLVMAKYYMWMKDDETYSNRINISTSDTVADMIMLDRHIVDVTVFFSCDFGSGLYGRLWVFGACPSPVRWLCSSGWFDMKNDTSFVAFQMFTLCLILNISININEYE